MAAVRILAALLVGFSIHCSAAPFFVQVGEAKLVLDAPRGFTDTTFTGSPRLQELGESLTSASNRVLLFALSDADLRRFTLGDPLELRRYMIAATSRAGERDRLTENAFKALAAESLRELGTLPALEQYQSYLESRPAGAVSALAELRNDRDAIALLQGTRTKGRSLFERSKYMLSSTSLVLLRGKALSLSVYTQYDDASDLEWIRATTARWIDELKRLNSR
jgi:hypothetical protein